MGCVGSAALRGGHGGAAARPSAHFAALSENLSTSRACARRAAATMRSSAAWGRGRSYQAGLLVALHVHVDCRRG